MRRLGFPILLLVPVTAAGAVGAADNPVRVTSDSMAYCQELAARFAEQRNPATGEAQNLAEEGERLCKTGHTRTGIAKLRRALRATQPNGT